MRVATKSELANRYSPNVHTYVVCMVIEHQGSDRSRQARSRPLHPKSTISPKPCTIGSKRPRKTTACTSVHDRRPGPDQTPRARDALGEQGSLHSKRVFYAGVTITPTEAMIGFLEEFGSMLRLETKQISDENYKIYGVCKACQQLKRECCTLAFCTLERLMTQIGIRGAVCGKAVNTTIPYSAALCPHEKVNHVFLAPAPTFSESSILPMCLSGRALSM